jgi:hypothetical protein
LAVSETSALEAWPGSEPSGPAPEYQAGAAVTAQAFICSFNEADIIHWTVSHLIRQGVGVHVIDCQSTDGTAELARRAGASVGQFAAPPVSWHSLLHRVEELVKLSKADWIMHCDADELRYAPNWTTAQETLLQGFERLQAQGYNAVDFQVLTFPPIDNVYDGSVSPEMVFQCYEPDSFNQRIGQVKAWRNIGPVELAESGGHHVRFGGRRVAPRRWLSKHYPIRSQAHGERKVFQERQWLDQAQGRLDWHVQYQGIEPGHNFLKDPATLMRWE